MKKANPWPEGTTRGAGKIPHLSVDVVVDSIGYQMDVYVFGAYAETECRDFGGSPAKDRAIKSLIVEIHRAVDKWRRKF